MPPAPLRFMCCSPLAPLAFTLLTLLALPLASPASQLPSPASPSAPPTPSRAHIIALNATSDAHLVAHVSAALALPPTSIHVARADRGTNSSLLHSLPLYTRHLLHTGRHDHMQISNPQMIGCLMSHVAVWREVRDWAYVFEEDVVLPPNARAEIAALLADAAPHNWSILMLQPRSFIAEGAYEPVGRTAARCAQGAHCTWFGTRGYIITERGARTLLQYWSPIVVQVDSLIGLVASFEPRFTMLWATHDITGPTVSLSSTVWDWCLRCYIQTALNRPLTALALLAIPVATLGVLCRNTQDIFKQHFF